MLGRDIILHAVMKVEYRVLRDSKGEGAATLVYGRESKRGKIITNPNGHRVLRNIKETGDINRR